MNNIEKKLDALIDALGFDVEFGEAVAGDVICCNHSSAVYSTNEMKRKFPNKHLKTESFGGKWIVSEKVNSIKLTKKGVDDLSQLVEHLERVQVNFTTALKESYMAGAKDAREDDYMGLDRLALWEKSEVKAECDKNEIL